MAKYLTKAQVRDLLFVLDGERYDDTNRYTELKRLLFNSLPNYYGKRKYSNIKSYINKEIIPQRIQNIADDLEIFNSYVPPQHLTRLNTEALTIKDRIIQHVNEGRDFNIDFKRFTVTVIETVII